MKWVKISYQDYESLSLTLKSLIFLEALGIKSATKPADKASIEIDAFCLECKVPRRSCECFWFRCEDRDELYDAWADIESEKDES